MGRCVGMMNDTPALNGLFFLIWRVLCSYSFFCRREVFFVTLHFLIFRMLMYLFLFSPFPFFCVIFNLLDPLYLLVRLPDRWNTYPSRFFLFFFGFLQHTASFSF